jgi:hypothetical protein
MPEGQTGTICTGNAAGRAPEYGRPETPERWREPTVQILPRKEHERDTAPRAQSRELKRNEAVRFFINMYEVRCFRFEQTCGPWIEVKVIVTGERTRND